MFSFRSSKLQGIVTGLNFYFIFIGQAFSSLVTLFMWKLNLFKIEISFG